ncbi:MAG: ribonuclease HII [Patescibacteria group bacterium]|nr:ribonuclease HII [Patescibacteria group bacterium]MDD5294582.1 ribonuclease HII [Patescibacteria group bacterium]MDD5554299.1 ribonuclease HII [Patescibacteria group bacterium]
MLDLNQENRIFSQGYKLIASLDEAGRGPLAGPVVAACIVLPAGFEVNEEKLKLIADSKILNASRREELFSVISEQFGVGIGICDNKTIDKINIFQASFLAMKKALGALKQKPDFVLLDGGFKIPNYTGEQKNIIKGDSLVFSIAAASIIAKVTRDNLMKQFHEKYPQYGFDQHKGYGTKLHLVNLKKYGPCPIHRFSFGPVADLNNIKIK